MPKSFSVYSSLWVHIAAAGAGLPGALLQSEAAPHVRCGRKTIPVYWPSPAWQVVLLPFLAQQGRRGPPRVTRIMESLRGAEAPDGCTRRPRRLTLVWARRPIACRIADPFAWA